MSPRLLLGATLGFTLIFNIAWAALHAPLSPAGVLSVLAAAACTLIVPAGLHLWPQIPAATTSRRVLRALVMTGICAAATVTSFSHSTAVLLSAGWSDWTAWSVTGGAELLVALSTMALRTPSPAVAVPPADYPYPRTCRTPVDVALAEAPEPSAAEAGEEPAADFPYPGVRRALSAVPDHEDERVVELREWVAELGERPTETRVRRRFGCRQSVAKRLLAALDNDPADPGRVEAADPAEVAG